MNNEPCIKRGGVEGETEDKPTVTESDQTVKAAEALKTPVGCCKSCGCRRAALNNEVLKNQGSAE